MSVQDADELPPRATSLTDGELGAYAIAALSTSTPRGRNGVEHRQAQFAALGRILRAASVADVERLFGVRT